jgi:GABA(A) receptor-associated protein
MVYMFSNPKKDRTESDRVISKYPDRVPIIVKKHDNSMTTPDIDKHKFLVPMDLTMGQFLYVIRKRIQLSAEKGLFLFINGEVASNNELVGMMYQRSVDKEDGFLHVIYSCENVFG